MKTTNRLIISCLILITNASPHVFANVDTARAADAPDHASQTIDKPVKNHLDPIPDVLAFAVNASAKLKLDKEQLASLKTKAEEHKQQLNEYYTQTSKLEQQLHDAVIQDKPLSSIDQFADSMLQERQNIINIEAAGIEALQSVVDSKQFQQVLELYQTKTPEKPIQLPIAKHVDPMPKLIKVIQENADQLKLTGKQSAALKQWQEEREPVLTQQYTAIVNLEKAIYKATLSKESNEKLAELNDAIMRERMKVIRGRAFGREKIKQILNAEQYQQLIEIYRKPAH